MPTHILAHRARRAAAKRRAQQKVTPELKSRFQVLKRELQARRNKPRPKPIRPPRTEPKFFFAGKRVPKRPGVPSRPSTPSRPSIGQPRLQALSRLKVRSKRGSSFKSLEALKRRVRRA